MRSSSASSSSVERRVDRIRASLADRLLPPSSADSGASNDHTSNEQLSDTAVARLLAVEARRGKELSMVLGPKAFLVSSP